MKKPTKDTRKPDVAADNPEGTMERFIAGLSKVLSAPKKRLKLRPKKRLAT